MATRTIGEVLPALTPTVQEEPVQQRDLSVALSRLDPANAPARLDDQMLRKLEALAVCQLPPPDPCPEDKFMGIMATLEANLPSQHRGEVAKELRAEAYWKRLGHYPVDALLHLEAVALDTMEWFPTIAQCKQILEQVGCKPPLRAKQAVVRAMIAEERQARFDEAMRMLQQDEVAQEQIDALPEDWKRIGETRSLLWRHEDGSYTHRPDRPTPAEGEQA